MAFDAQPDDPILAGFFSDVTTVKRERQYCKCWEWILTHATARPRWRIQYHSIKQTEASCRPISTGKNLAQKRAAIRDQMNETRCPNEGRELDDVGHNKNLAIGDLIGVGRTECGKARSSS